MGSACRFANLVVPCLRTYHGTLLVGDNRYLGSIFARPNALFLVATVNLTTDAGRDVRVLISTRTMSILPRRNTRKVASISFIQRSSRTLRQARPRCLQLITGTVPKGSTITMDRRRTISTRITACHGASIFVTMVQVKGVGLFHVFVCLWCRHFLAVGRRFLAVRVCTTLTDLLRLTRRRDLRRS